MTNEFVALIPKQAARYGDREALRYQDYESQQWTPMSWRGFGDEITRAALAIMAAGLEPQARVAIFSQNCVEILVTHFGAFYNRCVPVPIYATSSIGEVEYIVNDSGAQILFTGDQRQYDVARELQQAGKCPSLKFIVTLDTRVKHAPDDNVNLTWQQFLSKSDKASAKDTEALEQRKASADASDLMYLIYTSGTTGQPKGVMLTHRNFNAAMLAHSMAITNLDDENDISLSFLPFSHVFELGWTMVCLTHGVRIAINTNPKEIQKAVKDINPTCMCSVPRFWEKVYTAIWDSVSQAKPVVKMLFKRAVSVGRTRNMKYVRMGRKVPPLLERQYQYFDKKVFARLRGAIGVTAPKFYPTAGAMLSDNITEFLHAIGINIVIGYGLSETNASVSFYPATGWELGTVGKPIPGVKVRIGEQNEILVKGPTVMKGYFGKPQETAEAIDQDGWFHTGDCGTITESGQLVLTERLKDLYKTSNGKYIAPQVMESRLAENKFVEQVAVIGNGRKFVSALIVPNFEELRRWADKKGIAYATNADLANDQQVHKMMEQMIDGYQRDLASYEQIKRFIVMPRPFTMESGELTNTMKIRRAMVLRHYAKLIDAIYAVDYRKPKAQQ